ncbi:hypothetical protein MIND_00472700 [Mycena indigotica]|uniref:Major facilitator superfamily (MFS) profile domain-containing protein n=1 Tax=Mycena indigotica TaxID=2126181 RepID=A0A8H6SX91_9AGAR|nr:uncharacterized protein MIND_00472700 [Mycena indigotica]KAF7306810.1 hypothetical protein MIND_00472700 [Mycena indigotica]
MVDPDTSSDQSATIRDEELVKKTSELDAAAKDPFLIDEFEEGDPTNPRNWSRLRRWYLTFFAGVLLLNATFASAAPSGITLEMRREFHMSQEVGVLALSIFVAGYVVGPLLWGPLSENVGRRPIFIFPHIVFTLFQVGAALAKNQASLLVFRFLGGVFAAAPLTNSGAIISDIWDANTRGKALALFTLMPFTGPTLGPTVSGFIAVSGTSFRWVYWTLAIFAGVCSIFAVLTLPETYKPVLLIRAAKRKREETGDNRYYAPLEKDRRSFLQQVENVLARPFKILFLEPMLFVITIYMSFIFGNVFLLFEAFPIVFTVGHGLNAGLTGLTFLPIALGGTVATIFSASYYNPRYERKAAELAPHPVPPEFRLEMTLLASPLYAISFFWFAWTSFPSISLWAPLMSGFVMGFAINLIFLSLFNYIIDTYLFVAASALAGSTVVRSLCGAAFPLFATQMYDALGPRWASSLLGFVALIMMPLPFVFVRYGPAIRARSRYAPAKPTPASNKLEA